MTGAQLALATRACKRTGRICIVGDDRQAIYAFRGADSGSLDRLKGELEAAEMGLTTTYRCSKSIVALAAKLVPDYKAASGASEGTIGTINTDAMMALAKEGDFIISRKNAPLVGVCMALLKKGVRARIKGRDIGKGVIALIRRLKPDSVVDLGIKMGEWQAQELERVGALSEDAAADRITFVQDQFLLVMALMEGASTVGELEGRINDLFSDDAELRAVMCSTVHKAKGLEADRVFLLEGTFRRGSPEDDNIKYVAITRAKTALSWVTGFESVSRGK
jgi:superfamily I DNA/RNA helicase